jgi:hypothetical protein
MLPCPFCSGQIEDLQFVCGLPDAPTGCSWYVIYCGGCGFHFQLTNVSKETAVEKWNQRNGNLIASNK